MRARACVCACACACVLEMMREILNRALRCVYIIVGFIALWVVYFVGLVVFVLCTLSSH